MARRKSAFIETDSLEQLLDDIQGVLDGVRKAQEDAGGTFVIFTDGTGRDVDTDKEARALKARIARDLARAETSASLLAAELQIRFGLMKGNNDPRKGGT